MNDHRWDKSLEKLCKSPEEAARLKETASLLADLPDACCSPSFQLKLRRELLTRAAKQAEQAPARRSARAVLKGKWGRACWRTPAFVITAAALLLFFLGTNVANRAPTDFPGPVAMDSTEQPEDPRTGGTDTPLPEGAEEPPAGIQEEQPGQTIVEPEVPVAPGEKGEPSGIIRPEQSPQPPSAPAEQGEGTTPLPDEPDYEVYKNRRTFTPAGNVVLAYGTSAGELYPVEKIDYYWQPNKTAPASTPEAGHFGTPEWAGQLLTKAGFKLQKGETVDVKVQETGQGLYAEIFYGGSPPLVLHAHQDKGILAYYYEETGALAPAGYYSLLTPAQALRQLQELNGSVEGQQLRLTFREVKLTVYDFPVEKNGASEVVRLPAYRFTGSELIEGKEGINLHVPAINTKQ